MVSWKSAWFLGSAIISIPVDRYCQTSKVQLVASIPAIHWMCVSDWVDAFACFLNITACLHNTVAILYMMLHTLATCRHLAVVCMLLWNLYICSATNRVCKLTAVT